MIIEIRENIRALLDQVASRISREQYVDVSDYLREHEWLLAMEILAYSLDEQGSTLTSSEWITFCQLAESVRLTPDRFSFLRTEPA